MNSIRKFRDLLKQIESDTSLPDEKKVLVNLLNTLIRSHELIYRSDEYLQNRFYLGYFLIQSQRIERTVAGIIDSAEKLRSRSLGTEERENDLNIPLGKLIGVLGKYVQGEAVFSPLKDFNNYRKTVIHRLSDDFSRPLIEIEALIAVDYPAEKVNHLQNILIEVQRRIGVKTLSLMQESELAKAFGANIAGEMQGLLDLSNLEFTILER